MSSPASKKYMLPIYGYLQIYGFEGGGLDRIKKELLQYNLYAVLMTCAKIGLTFSSLGQMTPKAQIKLTKDIFASDQFIRRKIYFLINQDKSAPWAIFAEQPLLNLAKLAIQICPQEAGKDVLPVDIEIVGRWLLILTDESVGTGASRFILPLELERERTRELLIRQYFLMRHENLIYRMARYKRIFEIIKEQNDFPIDDTFLKATDGVTLSQFLSLCFYMLSHWLNKMKKIRI